MPKRINETDYYSKEEKELFFKRLEKWQEEGKVKRMIVRNGETIIEFYK